MNNNTKKITTTAMLAAIAYVVVVIGRIPVVLFLKYDPKDIIITLGGLIWGPLTSFIVSVIVSMIEMVTISENGILGCIMNIVSSCSFACTTAVCHFHRQAGRYNNGNYLESGALRGNTQTWFYIHLAQNNLTLIVFLDTCHSPNFRI